MEHGRWSVTEAGWRVLKGEPAHRAAQGDGARAKGSRREKRAAAAAVVVGDADDGLARRR